MNNTESVKLIVIAGGSASGKTTIANKIANILKGKSVVFLKMDNYYRDFNHLSSVQRKQINYDHPDSIDIELLFDHINKLKHHQSIEQPIYDFTTNSRTSETKVINPTDVIILDGILALAIEKIRSIADIKIFIKTASDIRFIRRLQRDIKQRQRAIESIIEQYLTTVRKMHEYFVEPSIKYADIIVPYYEDNEVAIDMISIKINSLLTKE